MATARVDIPQGPATARGEATRGRIVDVAMREFARHGIAGARVERIVGAARTNKAQLYQYFGSKDGLFDAVFAETLDIITDVVPIDADDLADWAVRLYDEYLRRPEIVRLATWARLERRPTGHIALDPDAVDGPKLAAIADAQARGSIRSGDPMDIMAMVIGMSLTWSPAASYFAASADEPARVHNVRRELLRDCVSRAMIA